MIEIRKFLDVSETKILHKLFKMTTFHISFVDSLIVETMISEDGLPHKRLDYSIIDLHPTKLRMSLKS